MTRSAALLTLLLLAGCAALRVEERAIPSAPGAVAATAWESQPATLPGPLGSAPPEDDPARFLDRVVEAAMTASDPGGEVRHGLLSRDGSAASGYIQILGPSADPQIAAYEARLTLAREAGGAWTLAGVEVRTQCRDPLVAGECRPQLDNTGG
ncbi:MAG: hypothetical protein ABI622_09985 [Chloroflexota bacterium]